MSPTRKITLAVSVVCAFSLAVGYVAATFIKSPAQVAAETTPPEYSLLTATVETGTVQKDILATGTVALGNKIELSPPGPVGVDAVVTHLPVTVGDTVAPGSVLLEIADRPVLLLAGDIPQLRDLHRGDKGPDVNRLQQALQAFGGPVPDGEFGPGTEQALRALYRHVGYAPPLDEASRAVALRSELSYAPNGAVGTVVARGAALGTLVASPAMTITTAPLIVTAELSPAAAAALTIGITATVSSAALPGPLVGTVASIGALVEAADGGYRVPAKISIDGALPADSIDSPVQVSFDVTSQSPEGLLVPLSALHADPAGTTSVIVVEEADQTRIPVTVAETGGGVARVEAEGTSLQPGDLVAIGAT